MRPFAGLYAALRPATKAPAGGAVSRAAGTAGCAVKLIRSSVVDRGQRPPRPEMEEELWDVAARSDVPVASLRARGRRSGLRARRRGTVL